MQITWTGPAIADMRALEKSIALRIKQGVERFASTGAGDVKRLQGIKPPEFRLRVGDYRVRFRSETDVILILRVMHRSEAYR